MAKYQDLPAVETRLYVNGKWVEGSEGTKPVTNPATGETLANVHVGGEKEVKAAIKAANKAFPEWSRKSASERAELMNKMADFTSNKPMAGTEASCWSGERHHALEFPV